MKIVPQKTGASDIIRMCRYESGITQKELSGRVGINQSMMSLYECGRNEPRFAAVQWMLDAMGYDLFIVKRGEEENDN